MDGRHSGAIVVADIDRLHEQLEQMLVRAKAAATEQRDEGEDAQVRMVVRGK